MSILRIEQFIILTEDVAKLTKIFMGKKANLVKFIRFVKYFFNVFAADLNLRKNAFQINMLPSFLLWRINRVQSTPWLIVQTKNCKTYLPSVSTMGNFFTIAFLFDIFITPKANVTVTTMGRPSGIAATAKLTPMVNISKIFRFCTQPNRIIRPGRVRNVNIEFLQCRRFYGVFGMNI